MKPRQTISAPGTIVLGRADMHSNVAMWRIHISGPATFTMTPKGYVAGGGNTSANADFTGWKHPYDNGFTNPGVTPINANGVYDIEAGGMEVILVFSAVAGGTVIVDAEPLDG